MRSVVGLCSSELAGTSSSPLASFRRSEHPRGIIPPISDAHAYPSGAHYYHHNTATTTNDGDGRRTIALFGNKKTKKHKHKHEHVSFARLEPVACCRLGIHDGAGASSSSPRFASASQQNVGARPFHVALGQGEKLGQCVQRSLEGLNSWMTGGGGRGDGGDGRGDGGGGGGDNGGHSWGGEGGDMDRVPETEKSAIECSGHGKEEDGEDKEEEEAQESSLGERLCEKQEEERLEQEERLELRDVDSEREYLCRGIEVVDMEGLSLEEDSAPYEVLGITVGHQYRKVDLEDALSRLLSTGWYEFANMQWVAHSRGGIKLIVTVKDATYSKVSSFQCINISPQLLTGAISETTRLRKRIVSPCLLPGCIQQEITTTLQKCKEVSKSTLYDIQERIENWYRNKGYTYAKVKSFQNSEAGVLECHVDEGVITEVSVSCEGDWQQPTHCNTSTDIILERVPFAVRRGMQYNEGAAKAALNRVEQLGLFDKVHVLAAPDPECVDRECILLHILAKERALYSASVNTEWSFLCNDAGRPTLRTLQPGGSLSVQRSNISGQNRTISGSIATSNLQCPEEDLRFNLKYEHPHVTGLHNPHKCTLRVGVFNKRKLTATFSDPENQVQVPAVWIDRAGVKASLTEKLSRQSKLSYGMVIEEVATRDVAGTICNQRRNRCSGKCNSTFVSTGVDHLAFLQMKITRSNLQPGETGLVGARDIFQVDQGLGLGTHAPMFNRHQLSMTRYMPIPKHPLPKGQLPTVIVLHSRYSGCVGDVPSYRTFTNGGPYALRGHNTGELPGNSRFIEVAGEVRVPIQQVEAYGFFESLTNLQKFDAVWKNPRSLARRVGNGIMYGAGVKMGNVRIEYVIDCSDQTGSLKVYSGERY